VGSGILGLAAGGGTGYYIDGLTGGAVGLFLGAIMGVVLGAILRKWSWMLKDGIDEMLEAARGLLKKNQKKTLKMNKEMETLMNVSGPYIKTTKWYRKEYKYIQERLKEIRYDQNRPKSIANASTSYQLLIGDLNRLKRSIDKYMTQTKGSIRESPTRNKKKLGDRYTAKPALPFDPNRYSKIFGKTEQRETDGNVEADELNLFSEGTVYDNDPELEMRAKPYAGYVRSLKPKESRPVTPEQQMAIAGYKLDEQLNSSDLEDIYMGKDRYGNKVMVKSIPLEKDERWGLLTMAEFKADAKEWKGLEHENIVKLFKTGFTPSPYIAMERVEGGGLDDLMKDHDFSINEVIHIIGQLLKALSYAHEKEVIHLDFKPESILFDEKGTAKVSDWGLDYFLLSLNPERALSNKRRLAYLAPEQIRPKDFGKPGKATDIFRLGILFYEILTKKHPFYDEEPEKIRSMITEEDPMLPSSLNPEVPAGMDSIIMRSLEKQKKMRWKSADDIYRKLAGLMTA